MGNTGMAEKSQAMREKPVVKTSTHHFQCRSTIFPAPAVIRAKRMIKWQILIMDAGLLCMALAIGGLIMMLLGR